jgi:hypothetical protein
LRSVLLNINHCGNATLSKKMVATTNTLFKSQVLEHVAKVVEPYAGVRRPAQNSSKDFVRRHGGILATKCLSDGSAGIHPLGNDTMANAKRVVFSFDERSLESLEKLKNQGRFSSMGDAVRESLQINRALQSQANQGFTEVIVRNPETKEERVIVIPALQGK